jgi:hypothetical protein
MMGTGQDRRLRDRREGIERRRASVRVEDDRRFVADRRRGLRRGGLAARLGRYLG